MLASVFHEWCKQNSCKEPLFIRLTENVVMVLSWKLFGVIQLFVVDVHRFKMIFITITNPYKTTKNTAKYLMINGLWA
jgi:hypothetical protein